MPNVLRLTFIGTAILQTLAWGCSYREVAPRGEPIRVGQMKEDELHLREIPLERYIAGVLEKEVRHDWPLEALKAQAVAARTYAIYRKSKPRDAQFDVLSDTSDQVFESDENHSPAIVRAVRETEGETLQFGGRVLEAFFHSCCGGTSEDADQVWPGSHPEPLRSVHEDPYCSTCPPAHWKYRLSFRELGERLSQANLPSSGWTAVSIVSRDASGRVEQVTLESATRKPTPMSGITFRKILGYTNLKSTLFNITAEGEDLVFDGRGAGHGVGLCQWGAKAMAEKHKNYRDILNFYYPGAEIVGLSAEVKSDSAQSQILGDLEKKR